MRKNDKVIEMMKKIIVVCIVSALMFSCIGCLDTPPKLAVIGAVENVDYINSKNAYVVEPGQTVTISVEIYNDDIEGHSQWFYAAVYQVLENGQPSFMWTSPERLIPYQDFYVWTFTYRASSVEGQYPIYIESLIRLGGGDDPWVCDDIDTFNILVQDPTPDPTPTATPTATPPTSYPPGETPTVTPTATATVQPSNIPPSARITYEDMGNGKIVLRGTESTDPDGIIEEFKWHLNDQYINGQSTFTHVFDEAGTHTIRLDVIDNDGGSSSAILIVTLQESENSAGVVIGDVDDTQAASQPAAGASGGQQPRGIWIEDGALMMPGFEALFAIAGLIMVYWNVHRRREE